MPRRTLNTAISWENLPLIPTNPGGGGVEYPTTFVCESCDTTNNLNVDDRSMACRCGCTDHVRTIAIADTGSIRVTPRLCHLCCTHSHCSACGRCPQARGAFGDIRDCHCANGPRRAGCAYCGRRICPTRLLCNCCPQSEECQACCQSEARFHRNCCGGRDLPANARPVHDSIQWARNELTFFAPSKSKDHYSIRDYRGFGAVESEYILGNVAPLWMVNPKGFTRHASRRFAATEIEVDATFASCATLNRAIADWRACVVQDGTIGAFEINSSPACGDALPAQINDICAGLTAAQAHVADNCGLHVHVDCRDFGYQEIQKLVRLYAAIEETLFASVHPMRYNNIFARHCGDVYYQQFINNVKPDTKSLKRALVTGTYGEGSLGNGVPRRGARGERTVIPYHTTRTQHYGQGRGTPRYNALNVHTYFMRGTVEFRLHHGALGFEEIYGWMRMLIALFDYVYKASGNVVNDVCTVSPNELADVTSKLDLASPKGWFKRNDVSRSQMVGGLITLSRILAPDNYDYLLSKIRYFAPGAAVPLPCEADNPPPPGREPSRPTAEHRGGIPYNPPNSRRPIEPATPRTETEPQRNATALFYQIVAEQEAAARRNRGY